MAAVQSARGKARYVATYQQLGEIKKAVLLLHNDTGKMPGGCPINYNTSLPKLNLYFHINGPTTGLIARPPANTPYDMGYYAHDQCVWSAQEAAQWNGPYISPSLLKDPWGGDDGYYIIDHTYYIGDTMAKRTYNCPEQWFFDSSYRQAIIEYRNTGKRQYGWAVVSLGDEPSWSNSNCRTLLQRIYF